MIGRRALALAVAAIGPLVAEWALASGGARQRRLSLPDIPVLTSDRRPLRLRSDVLGEAVVAIDVIWAGCTTVCPISSRIMRAVQDLVPPAIRPRVRLVTLTADPLADTPERLAAYAAAVSPAAAPEWFWLTGEPRDLGLALRALRVLAAGHADNHAPIFYAGNAAAGRFHEWWGLPAPEEVADLLVSLERRR